MLSRKARRRLKQLILWAEIIFILGMGAAVGVVAGAFYQMSKLLPPDADIAHYQTVAGTKLFSSDGVLLGSIAQENRDPVEIRKIPKRMQDAIIAIEDSRFYQHSGLDFRGVARALWQNIRSGNLTRQGGSTLTQELARQIYLKPDKTMARKLKETMLAIQIERNWSKQKILETYLNQVYFGSRAYGVQAAAQAYFGKNVWQLNLAQCALLAGLPQRPSKLDPYENPAAAKERRNLVLGRMADLGMITPAEAEQAMRARIKLAHKHAPAGTGFRHAPFFCNAIVEQLREKYGDDLLYKGGFKVYTTLNWKMQALAEEAVKEGIERDGPRYSARDAALVCLDPNTGAVRAMVGGVNFAKNQYNVVTQGHRQPGSSFKAFVYTAAIEHGWSPYQSIDANRHTYYVGDQAYTPHNDDDRHYGYYSMVSAFASSINTAAVNTIEKIGPSTVVDYAKRFGIKSHLYAYPSLALGSCEVSPLEMANAYGVFATNGIRAEPYMVRLIKDRIGNVIEDNSPNLYRVEVDPQTIQKMQELFEAVVDYGTAANSGARDVPTAHGKTGTTTSHRDAWFIGYTLQPALVTAVWSGNLDNTPMRHAFGGTLCAPIWAHYMSGAVKVAPKTKLDLEAHLAQGNLGARQRDEQGDAEAAPPSHSRRRPRHPGEATADEAQAVAAAPAAAGEANAGNMVRVRVCTESMELATRYCPDVRTLEYVSGQEPKRLCTLHTGFSQRHRAHRRHRRPAPTEGQQTAAAPPGDATAATSNPTPAAAPDTSTPPPTAPATTQ